MIKRIFRKRLRLKIYTDYGASCPDFEEIFNWIYEAPLWDWKIRLHIACDAYFRSGNKAEWKEWAEKMLLFLSK